MPDDVVALADDEAAYAEFSAAWGWLDADEERAREIEAEAAAKEAEALRRIEANEGAEAARQAIPVVRSWFRRESPTRSVRLLGLGLGCRMPVRRPEVRVRRSRRVGSARRARSPARRSSDDPSPPRDLARRAA